MYSELLGGIILIPTHIRYMDLEKFGKQVTSAVGSLDETWRLEFYGGCYSFFNMHNLNLRLENSATFATQVARLLVGIVIAGAPLAFCMAWWNLGRRTSEENRSMEWPAILGVILVLPYILRMAAPGYPLHFLTNGCK